MATCDTSTRWTGRDLNHLSSTDQVSRTCTPIKFPEHASVLGSDLVLSTARHSSKHVRYRASVGLQGATMCSTAWLICTIDSWSERSIADLICPAYECPLPSPALLNPPQPFPPLPSFPFPTPPPLPPSLPTPRRVGSKSFYVDVQIFSTEYWVLYWVLLYKAFSELLSYTKYLHWF